MIEARRCIGGPNHGLVWTNAFTSLPPVDYNLTTVSNGVESYEFWTHKGLTSEEERMRAIVEYCGSSSQDQQEVED